jgi:hypothetical protein
MITMREAMPTVTALIDDLRLRFGRNEINQAIREGLADRHFYAAEGGRVVGVPLPDDGDRAVRLCDCSPWNDKVRL